MAKEFDPDKFLEDTAPIAEAQSEIERKNAERAAIGQQPIPASAATSPSGGPVIPTNPPGVIESAVAPLYGAAKAAGSIAAEHPGLAAAGAYGASYVPGLNKLPPFSTIKETREAVSNLANRFKPPVATPSVGTPMNPIGGNAPLPTGPVAPAGVPAAAPAQAAEASMLDKATAMMRQMAANRALQTAAKGGIGAGAMMYSPELGPAVPSVGRMRGSEINPLTGRAWTREQIAQYEANPTMYDSQMAAPQFRR